MNNPKISIIVPIYNTEKHLRSCIDSILAQTFTDFELLLIDDGSKDGSYVICAEYAATDERVKTFHKENGGANSARKFGVQCAISEYTMFVDSDDTIDKNALANIWKYTEQYTMDIIVAHTSYHTKIVDKIVYLQDVLTGRCWGSMCGRLYKTGLLTNHFLDIPRALKMGEDMAQNVHLANFTSSIMYCDLVFYSYRKNRSSVSNTFIRTWDYEKNYYEFLQKILNNTIPIDPSVSEAEKRSLNISLLRCRLNGAMQVLLCGKDIPLDNEFISIKLQLRKNYRLLNIEELLMIYCPNMTMCKLGIRLVRKIKHIFS